MDQSVTIPIPVDLFTELTLFLKEEGDTRSPIAATCHAIRYWIENASGKPELIPRNDKSLSNGYTWKHKDRCLFLPHGTRIRMRHKGEYHYAVVEGDDVQYRGQVMSPAKLANVIAQGSRNAWIYLWIKRPRDAEWKLADQLSPGS